MSTGSARRRVVSLVPSSTETLLALGAEVVACTRFCEQPHIAHVGGTKNPDVDAILELAPDVVVLDREENRIEDHDALVAAGLDVTVTDVRSVGSALDAMAVLAEAAGVARRSIDAVPSRPPAGGSTIRAFVPIWRRPWMTIGPDTYGSDVLAHLGVETVVPGVGSKVTPGDYPEVDLDALAEADVGVVLVPSEPYEFRDDHLDELRMAAPGADVERVDGKDLFWWGIRTPGALSRLGRSPGVRPSA